MKIVFGCLLDNWGLSVDDIVVAVDIFTAASIYLKSTVSSNPFRISDDVSVLLQEAHWFYMMAEAAKDYQNSDDDEKPKLFDTSSWDYGEALFSTHCILSIESMIWNGLVYRNSWMLLQPFLASLNLRACSHV
jgi:hypothetical protein